MRRLAGLRASGHVLRLAARADRRATVAVIALVFLGAGAIAATGLSQRWLINAVADGSGWRVAGAVALGVLGYTTVTAAMRVQFNLRFHLAERVEVELTREVLQLAMTVPAVGALERADYQNRLTVLRNGTRALASSVWTLIGSAAAVVSLLLSVWLLATVDPALMLLIVLALPPLLAGRRAQRVIQRAVDAIAEDNRHEQVLHELCTEASRADEIRVAGNGPELSRRAHADWVRASRTELRARLAAAGWEALGWCCYVLGLVVAVLGVAHLVQVGRADLGDLMLVITLALQVRRQIAEALGEFSQLAVSGRVASHFEWLRQQNFSAAGGPVPARLNSGIRLEAVSFRYPDGARDVVREVDLALRPGTTVALVGVNGAGKTTLVKLLTGMYQPTGGRITVDGTPLPELSGRQWLAEVSATFQDFVKLETRLRESVGAGDLRRMQDQRAVSEALARTGSADLLTGLPDGLETQLGTAFGGTELSRGQWQRVALARCLMRPQPLLLVLDEPTAALDPEAEHHLFRRFVEAAGTAIARRGAIVVLVSHRLSTVRMADVIVVLEDGRVVEQGSHDELMRERGRYAELYRTQAAGYLLDTSTPNT